MSLNNFTQYHFSNEHGVTGTLAADPTFNESKAGKEYARFAIYCKAVDANDDKKDNHHIKKTDTVGIPLIAYVSVFDDALLDDVEQLKKGYFVNFTYHTITWNLGEDEKNNKLRVNPTFVANSLAVRHIPGTKKVSDDNGKSDVGESNTGVKKTRTRRKK